MNTYTIPINDLGTVLQFNFTDKNSGSVISLEGATIILLATTPPNARGISFVKTFQCTIDPSNSYASYITDGSTDFSSVLGTWKCQAHYSGSLGEHSADIFQLKIIPII